MRATVAVLPRDPRELSGVFDSILAAVNTGASAYSSIRAADANAKDAKANLAATLATIKQNNAALVAAASPIPGASITGVQPAASGGSLTQYAVPAAAGLALLLVAAVVIKGRRSA